MLVTPTKSSNLPSLSQGIIIDNYLPSTPPAAMAPFMSTQSTTAASPPSADSRKRKLESLLSAENTKRPRASDSPTDDGESTPTSTLRIRTLKMRMRARTKTKTVMVTTMKKTMTRMHWQNYRGAATWHTLRKPQQLDPR